MGFFFQAEDGIRDYKVTGVQTCALPIYALGAPISLGLQATLGSLGGTLLPTDQVVLREENDQYVLDVMPVSDGGNVARRLWFTRSTLEVARQDLFDASGALQATMVYQDYRAVGSTSAGPLPWPTRVQAGA